MKKDAQLIPRGGYLRVGLAALACIVAAPGITLGADRMVLCEEFTATW